MRRAGFMIGFLSLIAASAVPQNDAQAQTTLKTWDICWDGTWVGNPIVPLQCAGFAAVKTGASELTLKIWNYSGFSGTGSSAYAAIELASLYNINAPWTFAQANNTGVGQIVGGTTSQPSIFLPQALFASTYFGPYIATGGGGVWTDTPRIMSDCARTPTFLTFATDIFTPCAAPDFLNLNNAGWVSLAFQLPFAVPDLSSAELLVQSYDYGPQFVGTWCAATGKSNTCDATLIPYSSTIPEPSTWALMALGGVAVMVARRRHPRTDA